MSEFTVAYFNRSSHFSRYVFFKNSFFFSSFLEKTRNFWQIQHTPAPHDNFFLQTEEDTTREPKFQSSLRRYGRKIIGVSCFHITQIPRTRTNSGITNRVWYDRWCTGTVQYILKIFWSNCMRRRDDMCQCFFNERSVLVHQQSNVVGVLYCIEVYSCIIQTSSLDLGK